MVNEDYDYIKPEDCLSPIPTRIDSIVYNCKDYAIAKLYYRDENELSLGIRWHLTDYERKHYKGKKQRCKGYPNTRGLPTWFILPISCEQCDDLIKLLESQENKNDRE